MESKIPAVRGLATLVAAIALAVALIPVAGPVPNGDTVVPAARPATAHVFVPTSVGIVDRDADPAPTF